MLSLKWGRLDNYIHRKEAKLAEDIFIFCFPLRGRKAKIITLRTHRGCKSKALIYTFSV